MVKVSEALFERIRERVEYLIHKRVGEGVRLSGEEKAVIRDELKTLIAGAHSISNKDLARVASRVATWKAQSNARSGGGGGGGGGGGATSSILPPVKCSTPQTEVRSQVLARRSTIDTPSSVTQVSSRQPQPPRQVPKGKNKWASGIKEDVERYQQEQAVLTTTLRNNISKHRADLERQVNEKKAAALNEREEEKRYLQTQATCNEEREKEFLQQQDNKRRVWERARAERVKDYHTRLDEKERLVQMARKEDEAVAEELNRIVASEKEKKKEKRMEKQQKVQELNRYLKDREKSHLELSRQKKAEEREEFMRNLDVLDEKDRQRRRAQDNRKAAFARHQDVVDGMAPKLSQKGNTTWVNLGNIPAERMEQERVKRLITEEYAAQSRKRQERACINKAELDLQIQEKHHLTKQHQEHEDHVHGQLLRHLKMVEDRERTRKAEQRQLEQAHKRTLDMQVEHRRMEKHQLEIGV